MMFNSISARLIQRITVGVVTSASLFVTSAGFNAKLPASTYPCSEAIAAQFADGSTAFVAVPSLVSTRVSQSSIATLATYSFTVSVPANAGTTLQAISISQDDNSQLVHFAADKIQVYSGDRAQGTPLKLAAIGGEELSGTTVIVFDSPIQPGNTITVTINAQTPSDGGVYQYGVTAYPTSSQGMGQFLGYGRLSFSSR